MLGHDGVESEVGVGVIYKAVLVPHGAVVALTCGDGFIAAVIVDLAASADDEDDLAVALVGVNADRCARNELTEHDVVVLVLKGFLFVKLFTALEIGHLLCIYFGKINYFVIL